MARDPSISVVLTTRNEGKNLRHLLDSLAGQVRDGIRFEQVIIVDAQSTDRTVVVANRYTDLLPGLEVITRKSTRGEGRNIAASRAHGDLLCFTDADCIANAYWLHHLGTTWTGDARQILAGRTNLMGYWAFTKLHRVELPHQGFDTTWPSCNLAYPRELFEELGGFDPRFITAEDIDLNFRAIAAGAVIDHVPDALIYARARDSVSGFLRQAFWNGYGRKQLTLKHGRLWHQYSFREMVRIQGGSFWGVARMGAGTAGYMKAKLGGQALPPLPSPQAPGAS